jgi:membrane protein implicated in regulation of membrane protease activity
MLNWWASLTVAEQIFAYVAIPSTMILILQTLLLLLGFGDHDGDGELDGHFDADSSAEIADTDLSGDGVFGENHPDEIFHGDSGLRLFTVRGLIAFFAVMGWTGLVLLRQNIPLVVSAPVSLGAGFLALLLVAWILSLFYKAQSSGNMELKNALGSSGTVYITIPPARQEQGKVNLILDGQYVELSAVTDNQTPIPTGTQVTVVGISGHSTLVVKCK